MQCKKCGQEMPESAAFCPYCGEKAGREGDKPLYQSEVKGWLKSGRLTVYRDRVEFSTSSVQKMVFNYDCLVSVKKRLLPTPAILFITEDARTEACAATSKNIHEAFLYVEQAARPYIEARKARLLAQGIQYSLVSSMGMTNSGILNISDSGAEFLSKSGQRETVPFQTVKSAAASAGTLDLFLFDGETKSFGLDKELREEVLDFVRRAIAPYLEERRQALMAKGIYYSFHSSWGQESGNVDILADRADFTGRSGQAETVEFRRVRTAGLCGEMLELALTDGTVRAFSADRDEREEILSFLKEAIEPYVTKRTQGFETSFGYEERIEINQERGVFHIIRQNGAVVTEEDALSNLVKCQRTELTQLNPVLTGIRMGGKAIASKAAEMAGRQGTAEEEERVRAIDILLTVQTGADQRTETLRFGDFPLGLSRTSPKYIQCAAEAAGLMDFLEQNCPECQLTAPAPPEPEPEEPPVEESAGGERQAPDSPHAGPADAGEQDPLGVQKYLKRISRYIDTCQTPMTIAVQGSWGSGEGGLVKMLSDSLAEKYRDHRLWVHTKQLARSDLGEKLPMFIGATLVSQLGGAGDGRVVKFAKAFINLSITLISQGNSDGQFLIDTFFRDNPTNSLEELVRTFSELVRKKCGEGEKMVVFVDGLDSLAPAKVVEILEAMEEFFGCGGCVFVVAADYTSVVQGMDERYGRDEERGKDFFNKTFRISFRLPVSGIQMEGYVKSRLERLGLAADDGEEVDVYCKLLTHSVGGRPENIDHLFDAFQLLKTLADEEIYENRDRRMILFGLVCMQTRFLGVYDQLVQRKDSVTPELLLELGSPDSEIVACSGLTERERADFSKFAQVFCDMINADHAGGISRLECGVFVQVLEFSSITSR